MMIDATYTNDSLVVTFRDSQTGEQKSCSINLEQANKMTVDEAISTLVASLQKQLGVVEPEDATLESPREYLERVGAIR